MKLLRMKSLFFPLLTVILIGILGHIILYIPPDQYSIPALFAVLYLTLLCLIMIILKNFRRSALLSLGIIFLAVLSYFKVLSIITGLLVLAFIITMELLARK